ncbi:MAG: ROK family protein [Spirochaetaceae bacterium]
MILTTGNVRDLNRELIRDFLRTNKFGDKNSISKSTGLSISSCRNILNDMIKTGEITETSSGLSNGGRPYKRFCYNKDFSFIGVISVRNSGDKIYLYNSVNNLFKESIQSSQDEFSSLSYSDIEAVVTDMVRDYPKLEAVSIGIPGIVIDGYIDMCDVEELSHIHLKQKLEEKFSLTIVVENDVNAAAIGYYTESIDKEVESFVYIYFPHDGILGAGIIINGKIIRGATNFAGEVGSLSLSYEYEKKKKIQDDMDTFLNYVSEIIVSVNAVLNPNEIIISWSKMEGDFMFLLAEKMLARGNKQHLPKLNSNNNLHTDYINGLLYLGMKEISCKIGVTEL